MRKKNHKKNTKSITIVEDNSSASPATATNVCRNSKVRSSLFRFHPNHLGNKPRENTLVTKGKKNCQNDDYLKKMLRS